MDWLQDVALITVGGYVFAAAHGVRINRRTIGLILQGIRNHVTGNR